MTLNHVGHTVPDWLSKEKLLQEVIKSPFPQSLTTTHLLSTAEGVPALDSSIIDHLMSIFLYLDFFCH